MSTQPTHDDANLILRLYELRREEKLRQARDWFAANYRASSFEEAQRIAPMGSAEHKYTIMVTSYWDMAASFVASGVLNQELFFQSGGEMLVVWERIRLVVPELRQAFKSPHMYENLEKVAGQYIQWMESKGPEAYAAFQQMVHMAPGSARPMASAATAKTAS